MTGDGHLGGFYIIHVLSSMKYNYVMQIEYSILYVEVNIFSLILVGIILHKTRGLSKMVAQRNFVMATISEMVFFASDTIFVMFFDGIFPPNGVALLLCKTVYFFSTATMCFFWFLYFEYLRETSFIKKRKKVNLSSSVIWLMGLLLVGNIFGKYLFYVDVDNTYHRGPLFILTYVLSYSYVILSSVRIITDILKNDSKIDRGYLILLALFPIAPGVSGIIQFLYPRIPVACMAMSLTTLVLYLNWVDRLIALDPLTGLSNRKQLILAFEQWKRNRNDQDRLFLMLVDANHFKSINDTYGHLEGDRALKIIAQTLKQGCKILSRRAIISRYGGDEFVVLIAADNDDTKEILKKSINDTLAESVKKKKLPFELTVSIGVAALDGDETLKDLIAKADEAMYKEKNAKR